MLKYGEKDKPGKEFRNTELDADCAALLHYADALATNETSGSMADMCSWLYRGSKKLFSTSGLDAVLPTEARIRLDAYWIWDRSGRGHGHDVADWLSAENLLVDQIWDRLGVENDSAIAPTGPASSPLDPLKTKTRSRWVKFLGQHTIEHIKSPSPLREGDTLRPVSVPSCLRAVGLMFGTEMVLDRHWLSLDSVNRNRTATMLIVQAPVGWRQSLASINLTETFRHPVTTAASRNSDQNPDRH